MNFYSVIFSRRLARVAYAVNYSYGVKEITEEVISSHIFRE